MPVVAVGVAVAMIAQNYRQSRREVPLDAEEAQLNSAQLKFIDYLQLVIGWLKEHR